MDALTLLKFAIGLVGIIVVSYILAIAVYGEQK